MFYKIVSGGCVVDATTSLNYVRWQEKNRLFLSCSAEDAQGIITSGGENIYLLDGMPRISGFEYASISEIDEAEYLALREEIDAGNEILDPDAEEETPDSVPKTRLQSLEEQVAAIAAENELLTECILELTALIYG